MHILEVIRAHLRLKKGVSSIGAGGQLYIIYDNINNQTREFIFGMFPSPDLFCCEKYARTKQDTTTATTVAAHQNRIRTF